MSTQDQLTNTVERTARELRGLGELSEAWAELMSGGPHPPDDNPEAFAALSDDAHYTLAELLDTHADYETIDNKGGPVGAWLGGVLEVVQLAERSLSIADMTTVGFRVLLSFGGPRIEATGDEHGSWRVAGYWGSDRAETSARCQALSDYLYELAET